MSAEYVHEEPLSASPRPMSASFAGQKHRDPQATNTNSSWDSVDKHKETGSLSSGKGWHTLSKIMSEHDEAKIRDCKEDMDTLLVFAGLFSAVLTAFNIESYKTLQSDPSDTTVALLLQISQQLNSFTVTGNSINSSIPFSLPPTTSGAPASVRINVLWFSALVCSLATASLAILVKQWLQEYMAQDNIAPRSRTRIRFWRWVGLTKWNVFEIAAFLPILLQISLCLFFVGLCVLLLSLDPVVGWIVTSLIIVWLSVYLSMTFAPIVSSKCPYKTPLLKSTLQKLRWELQSIFGFGSFPIMREEEVMLRHDVSLDIPILVSADETMVDDEFVDTTMRECLSDADGREVISCVKSVIVHRSSRELKELDEVRVPDLRCLTSVGRSAVINILVDAVYREITIRHQSDQAVEWLPWISSALSCVASCLLPMFSASPSARGRTQTAEIRAAHLLVHLLSENERMAKGVLEILARSRYTRFPSGLSITEMDSHQGKTSRLMSTLSVADDTWFYSHHQPHCRHHRMFEITDCQTITPVPPTILPCTTHARHSHPPT
ncbi:hypothetical protein QCA50_018269 [Cerrena zonata]|uniref:DUF6535 domain-containing protein n=1 Tax=Cerrena zonata TaxID=2478898 RepID=A0AAW0FN26_9APHY